MSDISEQNENNECELSYNKNKDYTYEHEKNWEWIPCVYDIKKITQESEITWNLSPSIILTLPSEQNVQPKLDLIIRNQRHFLYNEDLGWNWHKSWNIPDIHCTLDIKDPQTGDKLQPPSKIYAELYIVKAILNQIHTFHLVDVGNTRYVCDFDNSNCVFSGIKFNTTSYNHEGSKFHLVIVVYLHQNKFEHPKILESKISPPIFVDSRRSARDTQGQKPDSLDKKYVKRESKKKAGSQDKDIDNSLVGLIHFFTAPNIRNKVKHPLFLAIKFTSCVKLYYNTNLVPFNNDLKVFLQNLLSKLIEVYNKSKNTQGHKIIENKPIILVIENQFDEQDNNLKKTLLKVMYLKQ